MKRAFDFICASLGVIVCAPFFAVLCLLIKLDSRGPVFYRGVRIGRHGKPFRMMKFRTMVQNADRMGGSSTPEDDPRITRMGRLFRKYKLDELPQLFNVIRGEMSLVGPRPQIGWAVDLYSQEEKAVLEVRPGMTDEASLKFRDEGELLRGSTQPDKDYLEKIHPEKMRLSLEYVRNRSFFGDCGILVRTLLAIALPARRRGSTTSSDYSSAANITTR